MKRPTNNRAQPGRKSRSPVHVGVVAVLSIVCLIVGVRWNHKRAGNGGGDDHPADHPRQHAPSEAGTTQHGATERAALQAQRAGDLPLYTPPPVTPSPVRSPPASERPRRHTPPDDPATHRPPMHNPGGVNGGLRSRPVPGLGVQQ